MAASLHLKMTGNFFFFFGKRTFSTTGALNAGFNNSKMMQKYLQKKQRKKSQHWSVPYVRQPAFASLPEKGKKKAFPQGMVRRAAQMNQVYYDTVSQIVANGELDMYVDITKVKVVPDLSGLTVYWEAKGTEEDIETERLLQEKSTYLRHLMLSSNVLGRVPPITFAKDPSSAYIQELEHLFKITESHAEDHKTEVDSKVGKSVSEVLENENLELGESKTDAEERYSCDNMNSFSESPDYTLQSEKENFVDKLTLRQDLYGVKHDVLMQKIIDMKTSSRKRHADPVDFDSFKQGDWFSKDVQKFQKEIGGNPRAANMKQLSEFFSERKTFKKKKRVIVDDYISDSQEQHDLTDNLESEYDLDVVNERDDTENDPGSQNDPLR